MNIGTHPPHSARSGIDTDAHKLPPHLMGAAAAERPYGPAADEKINILMVDDRPENLISLAAILDDADYNLVSCTSGKDALKQLMNHDFALILLDVQMPIMDGFETASLIKSRERTSHIPIIFITAVSGDLGFLFKGYESGAVDYIVKPIDMKILRSKVSVFAELHRKTKQLEKQAYLIRDRERLELESQMAKMEVESLRREQVANEKYRDLVDGISNGIVWVGNPNQKRMIYVSSQISNILGFGMQEQFEKEVFSQPVFSEPTEKVIGKDIRFEHSLDMNGKQIWLHTSLRFSPHHDGSVEVRGLSVDVTAMKKAQEDAQKATKIRDQFLSIASHELRTPLTPLKLHLENLKRIEKKADLPREVKTEKLINGVEKACKQVDRLSSLVDELLDVARIGSGKFLLEREKFNLCEMIQEIVDRFSEEAQRQTTHITCDSTLEVTGFWDRMKLEQVMINLISNALKYGAGKPISIKVEEKDGIASICVKDHGMGIAPEDQERVFQLYERAVSPMNFGGLGLGLYIVRQIVREHGGDISLNSEIGKGSEFTVALPLNLN